MWYVCNLANFIFCKKNSKLFWCFMRKHLWHLNKARRKISIIHGGSFSFVKNRALSGLVTCCGKLRSRQTISDILVVKFRKGPSSCASCRETHHGLGPSPIVHALNSKVNVNSRVSSKSGKASLSLIANCLK